MWSLNRYIRLFDRACGISFIYNKENKGPNIDPWGTPHFSAPSSDNKLSSESKKLRDKRVKTLYCLTWKN